MSLTRSVTGELVHGHGSAGMWSPVRRFIVMGQLVCGHGSAGTWSLV